MPLVCLSLTAKTIAENLAVLERYRDNIDIAELRADLLDPSEAFAVRDFPVLAGLPCILAVRRKCDGGGFVDGEGQRLVILAKAIAYARPDKSANYAYVDLESDFRVPSVEEACHTFGTRIIRSRHDIVGHARGTSTRHGRSSPPEPDEIPKLAVTPENAADFARLFTWASSLPPGERIIVGMGEYGMPSRVLAERIGTCIAYTSALRAGLPGAAPGHLDPIALEETYRFRELDRETAVYALGGGPNVLTSKTPQLHNAAFKAAGLNAVFVPLPAGDVADLSSGPRSHQGARRGDNRAHQGSRSAPSSRAGRPKWTTSAPAIPWCARRAAGRATTPTPRASSAPSWSSWAEPTSAGSARPSSARAASLRRSPMSSRRLGASAVILNRTVSKARALAQRYGFAYGPCTEHSTELVADHSDIIIQATSVGMEGERQGDPLDWYDFTGRESVFDLIYRPERSALLERAAAAGCKTTNGWKMLRYQSAAQFTLWTGREPPASYFS